MKKLLAYEFRRILLPLCIFSAIAAVLYAVIALSTDFINVWYVPLDEYGEILIREEHPGDTLAYIPAVILCVLCTAVPAMQFSYRMKRRSVDLWYSLPVKRNELVLARTLSGLTLVLMPYTLSYWVGFAIIACSENLFHLSYYVPLFFASVPLAVLLFGINSFLFTRANTVGDGLLFIAAWTFLLAMPFLYLSTYFYHSMPDEINSITNYISYAPLCWLFSGFSNAIRSGRITIQDPALLYSLWSVIGAAAYFGLFFTAKKHPAENAGQISDSYFGYRVLIPAYLFFGACCAAGGSLFGYSSSSPVFDASSLVALALLLAAGLVAFFAYRRTFRIKLADLLSVAIPLICGSLVSVITAACI